MEDNMTEKICGIYAIINKKNGKLYIGQAQHIYKRWSSHKKQLNDNKSYSVALQNAWNKYGEKSFLFCILEECEIRLLDEKEILFISMFMSYNSKNGYNISKGGKAPMRGRLHSAETRKKMSETGKKNAKYGKDNHKYGKKTPEDVIEKIRQGNMGRFVSPEERRKISKTLTGRKLPSDVVEKMTKSRLGTKRKWASSKYMGVSYVKDRNKWEARLVFNKKKKTIGQFPTEMEAAIAYDKFIIDNNIERPINFPNNKKEV